MRWVRHVVFNNGFVEKHVRFRPYFYAVQQPNSGLDRPILDLSRSYTRTHIHTHTHTHVDTHTHTLTHIPTIDL